MTGTAREMNFTAQDGHRVHGYRWDPDAPRGVIVVAHGMGEHAARYAVFARRLAAAGFVVVAPDHRGHGRSAEPGGLGWMGEDGWNRTVEDLRELIEALKLEHPELPLVLFGHSMGAMLSEQFLPRYGSLLDGAILSGSPGFGAAFSLWYMHALCRLISWWKGREAESPLLQNLLFGSANDRFEAQAGEATGFEWLSRDAEEVRKYVEDPLCGFVLRAGSLADMFAGVRRLVRRDACGQIPARLPLYVFSGTDDPVHDELRSLERMLQRYGDAGVDDISHRWYDGGRHEMLNETNRELVIDDVLAWLESRFPRPA